MRRGAGERDEDLGGSAVADREIGVGDLRLDPEGAGGGIGRARDEGDAAGEFLAVEQPGADRGAGLDLVDRALGGEADQLDRVEVDDRGAFRARLEQRPELGGIGLEQPLEGRDDPEAVDLPARLVDAGLRALERGAVGDGRGLGGIAALGEAF